MLERRRVRILEIDKMVERQLRNWEIARAQRLDKPESQRLDVADFITISREVGAGASAIAAILSDRLGWPKFDNEILKAMTENDEARHRVYKSMDERDVSWWEQAVRPFVEPTFVRNDYFRRLVKTTLSLARQGSAIFIGRGIDCMLPRDVGFRVRLIAPLAKRVEAFAEYHGLSIADARVRVPKLDLDRTAFVSRHFGALADDVYRHDMTLNTGKLSPKQAAEAILSVRSIRNERSAPSEPVKGAGVASRSARREAPLATGRRH